MNTRKKDNAALFEAQKAFRSYFAAFIEAVMKTRGQNQCEFAKSVKVDAGKVGAWRKRESDPSRSEIRRLDEKMNCLGDLVHRYLHAFPRKKKPTGFSLRGARFIRDFTKWKPARKRK